MENASEALRIAGAVLIGVLLLALLVAFYNNISGYEKLKDNLEYGEQVKEFNKQYAIYEKPLYGSDVLSLVNLAANYNKLEAIEEGYQRLEIEIKFTNNYGEIEKGLSKSIIFKKNTTYSTDQIIANMNSLQENIKNAGEVKHAGYAVKKLALMRANELELLYERKKLDKNQIENANNAIQYYTKLKADEVTIKSKIYNWEPKKTEYDSNTGRVIKMNYTER